MPKKKRGTIKIVPGCGLFGPAGPPQERTSGSGSDSWSPPSKKVRTEATVDSTVQQPDDKLAYGSRNITPTSPKNDHDSLQKGTSITSASKSTLPKIPAEPHFVAEKSHKQRATTLDTKKSDHETVLEEDDEDRKIPAVDSVHSAEPQEHADTERAVTSQAPAEQVYTAPHPENGCYAFGPYGERPVYKISRPFDKDDDESPEYLSKSEEELLFHRGALLHFLKHCKKEADIARKAMDEETFDDKITRRMRENLREGLQLQEELTPFEKKQREIPVFFYYSWYDPNLIERTIDRFCSLEYFAEVFLRLNLINIYCGRDFVLEPMRSSEHRQPCDDCGKQFVMKPEDKQVYFALHKRRCYQKLCLNCVEFRSDLLLRMTESKRSLRQLNQLFLAYRSAHYLMSPCARIYGRGGLFDHGLTDKPIRMESSTVSVPWQELLKRRNGEHIPEEEILSSDIGYSLLQGMSGILLRMHVEGTPQNGYQEITIACLVYMLQKCIIAS